MPLRRSGADAVAPGSTTLDAWARAACPMQDDSCAPKAERPEAGVAIGALRGVRLGAGVA